LSPGTEALAKNECATSGKNLEDAASMPDAAAALQEGVGGI